MASILNVDQINNAAGTSAVTIDSSGNVLMTGHVVQVKYRAVLNNGFATTSSTMTDVTEWYVDITPKSASNILVWQSSIAIKSDTLAAYARYRIVDSNDSDTKWSSNAYMCQSGYYQNATGLEEVAFLHANTAGTTNAMRLQLQLQVNSGGSASNGWSNSDHRIIMVTEIVQ